MRQSLVLTFPGAEFVAPLEFAGNIEGMTLMAFSSMNFESKSARGQQRKKNQAQCKQIEKLKQKEVRSQPQQKRLQGRENISMEK
jgi:hypothetical protein